MNRRNFVQLGSVLAASALSTRGYAFDGNSFGEENQKNIDFIYDGTVLSPVEYAHLLMKLVDEKKIKPDNYSNGGVVEQLENKFAALLGMESAVFMPTGTLANHIAVRELANKNRRVLLQEQSHLYNDCGDCCQTLSNLNLIPLGKDSASFSLEEVEETIAKTKSGRVETKIGVIMIESPVRRKNDVMFGVDRIQSISAFAKKNGIKTHMDGARLFVEAAHRRVKPSTYSPYFDTIYTSMYKCFNAPSGAILAGKKVFTEKLFHTRRMFGGGLPEAWPFAAVALHFADKFEADYQESWKNGELFFNALSKDERCSFEKYENGTHMVRLNIQKTNTGRFAEELKKENIALLRPDDHGVRLKINPTINRINPSDLANIFIECLNRAM